ncbi:MAG TPA: beta-eliminating lyase-related protein [Gaiellaceae bacterium]|nr:beta-eliminating lyase-related protein [Gaiellaceae bacterium]
MDEKREREAWIRSERFVAGMSPRGRDPRTTLLELAERAPAVGEADRYGGGMLAERLESRIAELLGKEAAVWMPSGTMAQQIALRIHAMRTGRSLVAFHPHCHLDVHEERGYEWLHGLRATLLGDPNRLVRAEDVARLREGHAAVLLELPQRDLGGRLPPWDDLVATAEAARAGGAAVHLDGARLWQCGPFYGRPLGEIAALFDTVYVSFYKDLGAPAGCALAGPADVIAEARVWLVRHGGRLFSAFPYILAAERGLDEVLPRMPDYITHARELAAALAEVDGVSVVPDPPQVAMFHLYVRGEPERLNEAAVELAERTRTSLGAHFVSTADPAVAATELTIGEANLALAPQEAAELYSELRGLM